MQLLLNIPAVVPANGRAQAVALSVALFLAIPVALRAADKPMPTDEELRKIASAVPAKAAVAPKQPRKLLVFTLCKGYYHTSIPHGAKAVALMGEKTGAFKATISDDIVFFEPENLREFDGICLVSALGEFFWPDNLDKLPPTEQEAAKKNDARLKKNLEDYIRSGKGLAGIHGGCWAFNQTPAFADMLGATFVNHPWNSTESIAVKIDEPSHPVVTAFRGAGFEVIDEGYQFKEPYSRAKLRVLLSLDTARMDMNKPNLRADGDFGLCWVKRFGQGRVFYTALGHNSEEFWNPQLLRHFLDGIQFALGDLPADTEPR
ncbi:MAG: ThuA domain-containing protein [Verrucomicrobia bacterium]|nr:ThuA domain-containing protein [Verrucomicrobiota bacterium]